MLQQLLLSPFIVGGFIRDAAEFARIRHASAVL
jgi:hypothetical protein